VKELHAKIGQQALEMDLFASALAKLEGLIGMR
jgi:hypothetical protein